MSTVFPRKLIDFLNQPGSYPHKPDSVKHIQTHISHVFIASPYVYKFKKPVNFDFLDFSTLEKREYFCARELELNRRLCNQIYLDVVPIYKDKQSYSFLGDKNQEPVEFCVKMKQLSDTHFLIRYAKDGKLHKGQIDQIVRKLTPFYSNQSPKDEILTWGEPDRIRINTNENFHQTKPFIGQTIHKVTFNAIRAYTDSFLNTNDQLFKKRVKDRRIVDGHGDLHLEHIHMTGNRTCIYDCIEFNDRFRCLDIASDVAFLAMDLDFNGFHSLSDYFVKRITDELEDPDMLKLISFYKCYRAYVRGKVKSMESGEEEVGDEGRRRAAGKAFRYFSLSLNYALFGSEPAVLIFMGRIASGKSTLAKKISEILNIRYCSSDIERKKLTGLPLTGQTPESQKNRIYNKEVSDRTYNQLVEHAFSESKLGRSVVLDATFGDPEQRGKLISRLKKNKRSLFFIEVSTTDQIRKTRLLKRVNEEDTISDARLEDFDILEKKYHSPDEIDSGRLIRIDSGRPVDQSVEELFQILKTVD